MTEIIKKPAVTAVTDGPLTTAIARDNAPGLLLNEVEQRVIKIRPMSTPVDQISRMVPARKAHSMVVDYYTVDTKADSADITSCTALPGQKYDDRPCYCLKTEDDRIFAPTETLLIPEYNVTNATLVVYVVSRLESGLKIVPLNTEYPEQQLETDFMTGAAVRMGRAAAELDMQTDQFEALPVKASNYCQIFKSQVEQSAFLSQARKETGWNFGDQEEVAVMDMRLGMEKSFLFGASARLYNAASGDETLLTKGIWHQAQSVHHLGTQTLSAEDLTSLMRKAFTGEAAGSNRKVLLAGSGLIERLSNLESARVLGASDKVTRWGIDFHEICSKFGTLYVIHSEVFDSCRHSRDGLIIDPEYITKYVHVPFNVEHLDLKKSGIRNVDALVITEASCLVLRHPKAHIRIMG